MIIESTSESCYHRSRSRGTCVSDERKCREIAESPSMMWKRPIVQARVGCCAAAASLFALALLSECWGACDGADLVIEIPSAGGAGGAGGAGSAGHDGSYRLDYRPPHGTPAPNFTVPARASTINFQGLPGTKYHFMLYYSNGTFADLLTWNQTIVTAPEPPTNLTVTLGRNKQATISWAPPAHGDYTGFRFKVSPLTERAEGGAQLLTAEAGELALPLRDLAPGATYQLHAFTTLHDKESAAYASRNFTTKPNTPGKFIVWFRNETTLLVLWQPPYPPGFYTHYKVSIVPADARDSELYVEKEGEPPGPAQAAFKGLMPGRAYNISVQTVSEPEISAPTTAQYRTVPLRPRNVTAPLQELGETSFRVAWLPPAEDSEFEKYQVTVTGGAHGRLAPVVRARSDPADLLVEGLDPGAHYTVTVKTMSGKVTSWPAAAELTLKPLPVRDLAAEWTAEGALRLRWRPAPGSTQDEYRVWWEEASDSSATTVAAPEAVLDALLPGRNYTVSVAATSRGVPSAPRSLAAATRPLAPLLEAAAPQDTELRLAWRSDVTSRQDRYRLRYRRVDDVAAAAAASAADPPQPDDYRIVETRETTARLSGLFPGGVYEVRLSALSHGLASDELALSKPVRPLPPRALRLERASSTGAAVTWQGPPPSASALSGYRLRYRPVDAAGDADAGWHTLPPLDAGAARADLPDLTPGERYLVEVDTLSALAPAAPAGEAVASGAPLVAEHTVRPSPVSNVAQLVDTRNLTLEWPRGAGRVDRYAVAASPRAAPGEPAPPPPPPPVSAPAPPAAAPTVRLLVPGLEPGLGYRLSITAISYNLTSDVFTLDTRTRPLIQSEMTIVIEAEEEEEAAGEAQAPGILVTFTPTPAGATRFDSYRFRLERGAPEEGGPAEQPRAAALPAAAASARRVRFAPLVPGALYNVTMWTMSGNVSSHPVQRQARLFPRAVRYVNATATGARSVALAWPAPPGVHADFEVQYLAAADTLRTHLARRPHLALAGLRPHTLYTFTVVTRAGGEGSLRSVSRGVSAAVATHEAPPPPPRDFRPQDATPSRLAFVWTLPEEEANGVLSRFLLDYYPQNEPDRLRTVEFPATARSGAVDGLAPGATYEFVLSAETGGGRGAGARWAQHMGIAPPPRPPPHAVPARAVATATTVAVRFRADYFSPANGNVTAYTLVVGEDPSPAGARLPSWRDVQRLPRWPPYQATEPYYPFRSSSVEEFTIGSERCAAAGRAYCNGPLKPGTTYYVKLRAFTAPDKFTDTEYAEVHTETDNTAAWVAGGCVAAALAARLAPRARRRLPRPLPADVRRLRLPVQRGVRGAKARGARAAVHGGRPARQPAQEPVHEHPAVRPLALQAAPGGRRGGLRLHQRQLRARLQQPARVHRDAGPAALHARRLLAHVLGVGRARRRHADALRGEGPREVRPLLAVRHAARVLRGHRRHRAQREPLPGLDGDGAGRGARLRAARARALPLHDVARLRRAGAADGAGAVRARVPRARAARRARAPGRRALLRRRRPLRHLRHPRHGAAAARARRRLPRRLRDGARDAPRARLDGADRAAVHLHTPVPRRRARGAGPRAAAAPAPAPAPPPQRRLRRRRGYRGVRHVSDGGPRPPAPGPRPPGPPPAPAGRCMPPDIHT